MPGLLTALENSFSANAMPRILAALLCALALTLAARPAAAQSVAHGQQIYNSICVTCHGPAPGESGPEFAANNPGLITTALQIIPQMQPFRNQISATDAADIAAYVASVLNGGGSTSAPPPPPPPTAPQFNYSDLWFNPDESGWGFNNIQHASNNIFGVMFTYDAPNRPMWFVLPGGTWNNSTQFSGALYRVTGSPGDAPFKGGDVVQVGTATLDFSDASHATITYTVNGTQVVKSIQKQPF